MKNLIWTKSQGNTLKNISATVVLAFFSCYVSANGGQWVSAGQSLQNERHQKTESQIGVYNVADLAVKWQTSIAGMGGGDVWTTPAVDGGNVYFPDSAGYIYRLDRETGEVIWQRSISEYTGVSGPTSYSRNTPAIHGDLLIFGDQTNRFPGAKNGVGAQMMAIHKDTGDLVWITEVDPHIFSIITQSATVLGNTVFVGVSSYESAYAVYVLQGILPFDYEPTAQGSMVALDVETGAIKWKTYTTSSAFSGASVWGSSPSIDLKRGQVFIGTGQNFSMPDDVKQCALAAFSGRPADDPQAQEDARSCFDAYPDNHSNSIIAMDIKTGAINWTNRVIGYDTWHAACLFSFVPAVYALCPNPTGTDADFGQAPIFYTVGKGLNKTDLVGAGQKTGVYWAFDAETGQTVWATRVSPGGIAGGIQWGSAYDGDYIYTSSANSDIKPYILVDGTVTQAGIWSALDPATGEIIWQVANPSGGKAGGAASVANGVVYVCSLDAEGYMYAIDGATGTILWSFASGGSCNSGAAIVDGTVYWGSGYASGFDPTATSADNFQAFSIPAFE